MRFFQNNVFTPLVDKISETTEPILMKFLPHVPYTYADTQKKYLIETKKLFV